ncbi:C4-dicarboxylate ABC transporter substrate-binding protein [Nesterenkonia populi]|uniref:C4-dicarboxylate ABC transporter substrate-binding protein n=1 Tax=Nesterenkonia populi TaxID=1591087 RepID=UPI0011BFE379|nr:C4-dicarboxylate ABC transporter substrate-binding protein [Nesterenkonia populi]
MKNENYNPKIGRKSGVLALGAGFLLTACGGNIGANEDQGEGFEYGAPDEEVQALIEDLEPVTITYQPSAPSPEAPTAPGGLLVKEAIEERSNGQITVDLAWGHSVAGYDEVHDALADGRVDLSHTLPSYHPDEFPAVDAFNNMVNFPSSPWMGELAANAASVDVGIQTPEVMADFEDKGLIPLAPTFLGGGYYVICRGDVPVEASDWQGLQVRVGAASQAELVGSLGASPVSLDRTEVYEGLQRGTVDCAISQLADVAGFGLSEVAPHIGYLTETGLPRVVSALVASPAIESLPLPYQQIIHDAAGDYYHGAILGTVDIGAHVAADIRERGGSFEELSSEVQTAISEFNTSHAESTGDEGDLDADVYDELNDAYDEWVNQVEDLGYEDGGTLENMDEWHDGSDVDYSSIVEVYYEETAQENRPE